MTPRRAAPGWVAALFFASTLATAPARADPALWVVRSPTATIHLFGTIHVLKPGVVWRSAALDTAFRQSATLWTEIANPDDPAVAGPLMQQLGGADPAHPLSSLLDATDRSALAAAAVTLHMPQGVESLDRFRPWAAAVVLTIVPIIQAGYDPASGADRVLIHDAETEGKPVRGFETLSEQLHFLADLPEPEQIDFLHQTLKDTTDGQKKIEEMVGFWLKGDVDALARDGVEMKAEAPGLYRILVAERNQRFADAIMRLLAEQGTSFVAIGVLHLSGADSVQAALASRGVRVERE
jgi:uncharacterized protein YbaP (TraB family)